MTRALMHMMMPDHQIETFGDSDRVNAEDVMNKGAILFDDPQLARWAAIMATAICF